MEKEVIKIIEKNPVAIATCSKEGKPHVIAVAYVKVKDNKIVISDNYMRTTIENIKENPEISLASWNKKWEGYRINGKVEYFETGEYYDFVKSIEENKEEPCKGAVVVTINEIKKLG